MEAKLCLPAWQASKEEGPGGKGIGEGNEGYVGKRADGKTLMWKLFAEKRLFSPAVVGQSGSIRPIRANRD